MVGIRGKSSACDGIYIFINSQGWRGWLAIWIIWRKSGMSTGVGILDKLPGNACLLWINVSNPPL